MEMHIKDRLDEIRKQALADIHSSDKLETLNDIKVKYLGKKGR